MALKASFSPDRITGTHGYGLHIRRACMSGNGNRHHDVPKSGAQAHSMADIPPLYADISRVRGGREEFELLFGRVHILKSAYYGFF